jgi:predicted aspartyl protease
LSAKKQLVQNNVRSQIVLQTNSEIPKLSKISKYKDRVNKYDFKVNNHINKTNNEDNAPKLPNTVEKKLNLKKLIYRKISDPRFYIKIKILGQEVEALLDCGATISLLSKEICNQLKNFKHKIKEINWNVVTADDKEHKSEGIADFFIEFGGIKKNISCHLVPTISDKIILGMNFWFTFGIFPQINSIVEIENNKEKQH